MEWGGLEYLPIGEPVELGGAGNRTGRPILTPERPVTEVALSEAEERTNVRPRNTFQDVKVGAFDVSGRRAVASVRP